MKFNFFFLNFTKLAIFYNQKKILFLFIFKLFLLKKCFITLNFNDWWKEEKKKKKINQSKICTMHIV